MTTPEQTYTYQGVELPLWKFKTWKDMEDFIDTLSPTQYVARIVYELHPEGIVTGFIYKDDPLEAHNLVAAYDITDPEPQPGFEERTGGS